MSFLQQISETISGIRQKFGNNTTKPEQLQVKKFVYLLDPEDGHSTKMFAKEFQYFVDQSIEFRCVTSSDEISEDYPIALLLRRPTDNAEVDIQSILKHICKDLYERTAIINIHVVSNTCYLPKVPTAEKVGKFQDLGIILDFGLVDGKISTCNMGRTNSKQAFEDFVRKISVYLLDPEDGSSTKTFAKQFKYFVDPSIEFDRVKSLDEVCKDYPIALLLRRPTDRAAEDIQSILKHICKDLYGRTALINIHVVSSKYFLPRVPTAEKVGKFQNLGIILDFGLVDGKINACAMGQTDSKQIFEDFVRKRKKYSNAVLKRSDSSVP